MTRLKTFAVTYKFHYDGHTYFNTKGIKATNPKEATRRIQRTKRDAEVLTCQRVISRDEAAIAAQALNRLNADVAADAQDTV